MDNTNSLAQTKWNCKYHIVFAPKYRGKVIFGEKKVESGKMLKQLCEWKGVKIDEAEICPDHVHRLAALCDLYMTHSCLLGCFCCCATSLYLM